MATRQVRSLNRAGIRYATERGRFFGNRDWPIVPKGGSSSRVDCSG
jgi:hypothetical protein